MLITNLDNPTPKVGQILYEEYQSESGEFEHSALVFIDEPVETGKQWMYGQIALLEDYGNGLEVYTGFEAGGMSPKYTRIATDDDLKRFIKLIKNHKSTPASPGFDDWIEKIKSDSVILQSEKDRIVKITKDIS